MHIKWAAKLLSHLGDRKNDRTAYGWQACMLTMPLPYFNNALQLITSLDRTALIFKFFVFRIPDWLAAPSQFKQHWIRYSLIGLACFWSGRFLYLSVSAIIFFQCVPNIISSTAMNSSRASADQENVASCHVLLIPLFHPKFYTLHP